MDEEQTENAAEDNYTGAGCSIEVQQSIACHAGNDAGGGCEYVR